MNKLLTPLELRVMNILWKLKEAFVKDILEYWSEDSKPAYNTISTTVRILQEKGYVDYKAYGRTHQYFPLLSKADYQKRFLSNAVENVFSGSMSNLVSALMDGKSMSEPELEQLEDLIKKSK